MHLKGRSLAIFAALDFETADYGRDSACALSVIRVEQGEIVKKVTHLIRPPRQYMVFEYLHGISWADVCDKPVFGEVWKLIEPLFEGVDFIAAHNASFDKSVLYTCCALAGCVPPAADFVCTVKVSRRVWKIKPTSLAHVCSHFNIPLRHHDAASDALACAHIVLRALNEDVALKECMKPIKKASTKKRSVKTLVGKDYPHA